MDFLGRHVNNITLTTSSKNIQRRYQFFTELIHKSYFPQGDYFFDRHVQLVTSER